MEPVEFVVYPPPAEGRRYLVVGFADGDTPVSVSACLSRKDADFVLAKLTGSQPLEDNDA